MTPNSCHTKQLSEIPGWILKIWLPNKDGLFMGLQNAKMRCFSARTMPEQLPKDGAAVEAVDASTNPVHSVRNKWMNPEELDEWSDNNYINHSVNQYLPTIFHCKIQVFHIHPYPVVYEVWYPSVYIYRITHTHIHIHTYLATNPSLAKPPVAGPWVAGPAGHCSHDVRWWRHHPWWPPPP